MAIKWRNGIRGMEEDPATGPFGDNRGMRVPNVTNANQPTASSSTNGTLSYDTTNDRLEAVISGSWTTIGSAGSGDNTLDDAYDQGGAGAGRTITADSGHVQINSAAAASALHIQAATGVTTTDAIVIDQTGTGAVTDAIDASDSNITNALNMGANTITGTTGNITLTNFTVTGSSGAVTLEALDRDTAGTLTIGGSTATALTLTPNTTVSGTFTASSTAATGALTVTGDADITVSDTTGSGVLIDGSTITTGNVLRVEYDAGTAGGGFGAIEVTEDGAAVWTVAEDGNQTIAGTATGTAALTLTTGDITLSDGGIDVTQTSGDAIDVTPVATGAVLDVSLPASYNLSTGAIDIDGSTGTGPVIEIAMSSTYTGDYVSLNMTNAVGAKAIDVTGAGTRTAALVHLTDVPTTSAPTIDMDITPGAAIQAGIDIDVAGTTAADIITVNFSAAHTGSALLIDMTTAVAGTAIELTGAGTRTQSLVEITDTPEGAAGNTIDLNITPAAGTVACVDVDIAGTDDADIIGIDFAGAYTGDAVNITTTNMGAAGQAIVVDGSIANSGAIVDISTSGISTADGSALTVTTSTQPGAANDGVVARFVESGAAQATTYAVNIDSTNNEALHVDAGVAMFDESISALGSSSTFTVVPNFAQAAGSANAITATITDVAGTNLVLTEGLRVVLDLNSRTLQAGANTFNLNGGGALSIVSHYVVGNNIGTAYSANGFIELMYNSSGTVWMDMSQ